MRPHLHVRHRNRRNIHLLDQSMSPEPSLLISNYINLVAGEGARIPLGHLDIFGLWAGYAIRTIYLPSLAKLNFTPLGHSGNLAHD